MSDIVLLLLMLWALQQPPEMLYALKSFLYLGWLGVRTEWLCATRVIPNLRQGRGYRSDGIWFIRCAFVVCTLFCVVMAFWAVASVHSASLSLLWAMPTVILAAGFWGYMLADCRSLEERFRDGTL